MCPNGHDADQIEVKDNGARVCRACKDKYGSRRRRRGAALKESTHRQEGATQNAIRPIR